MVYRCRGGCSLVKEVGDGAGDKGFAYVRVGAGNEKAWAAEVEWREGH